MIINFIRLSLLILCCNVYAYNGLSNHYVFPTLPQAWREQHVQQVFKEFDKRWHNLRKHKSNFSLYSVKTNEQIAVEFQQLNALRAKIYYDNPQDTVHISATDYSVSQAVLVKEIYNNPEHIAFAYNCTDDSYNASTVLINGYHFIALQEPWPQTVKAFFKLLLNWHASILVKLKADDEVYSYSTDYWTDRIDTINGQDHIRIDFTGATKKTIHPVFIPYESTQNWVDDQGIDVEELYDLVQKVRTTYHNLKTKGPIVCHCASGVGRTGTFIAAFAMAEYLDHHRIETLSIEEIVLKLSLQRHLMVAIPEQYKTLYRFAEYYQQRQTLKQ